MGQSTLSVAGYQEGYQCTWQRFSAVCFLFICHLSFELGLRITQPKATSIIADLFCIFQVTD